ncbi:hypothetical protein [Halosimplex salinum]|uniref:hypothetical protein n=1 Tax=Halosimplex salinum TaxID=1710538 RepID=UPI0013DE3EFA|nr:hypothetical protein [Halosimplex salinum]
MRSNTTTDSTVRTASDRETERERDDDTVRRATRVARLLKIVATTLAALVGVAKALGLV